MVTIYTTFDYGLVGFMVARYPKLLLGCLVLACLLVASSPYSFRGSSFCQRVFMASQPFRALVLLPYLHLTTRLSAVGSL